MSSAMPEVTTARILVVEDESLVAMDIAERLTSLGYEVVGVVDTGEAAVEMFESLDPDLVVMDIQLAGEMTGTEAASRIVANRKVPILFLTAHSTGEAVLRARESMPYAYMLKPYDERQLAINVDFALRRGQMEAERERLINELRTAQSHIRTLSGMLPICSGCHRIRDDHGYWETVEQFVMQRSDAQFSHSICPDCMRRLYPDAPTEEPDSP